MSKPSSPFLKVTVTHAILMFSGKRPWLIERFNMSFKTPNIFYETIFITFDEISLLVSYYFCAKKKHWHFLFLHHKVPLFLRIGPSYVTYCSKCVFDTGIFEASFGPIFTKKWLNFSIIVFLSIISFLLVTILCRSLLFFHLDFLIVSFITF